MVAEDGMNKIICGDSLKVMQGLADKSVDLVLTDPPYGINMAKRGKVGDSQRYTKKDWDAKIPHKQYFDEMRRVSTHQIIWGGNYFLGVLPPTRCMLVWFKRDRLPTNTFADCEVAWSSFDENSMVFNCRWFGYVKDSKEKKVAHPTQKALEVMKWCVSEFSKPGDLILDPFLGSGTTAVAAKLLGRRYIGIEKEEEYVDIAYERLLETPKPQQERIK